MEHWHSVKELVCATDNWCTCNELLKESDEYGNGSEQASASDEDLDDSSDSDSQRKKKKTRPVIPGERKSTRLRRVAGSMVCRSRLEQQLNILFVVYDLLLWGLITRKSYDYLTML